MDMGLTDKKAFVGGASRGIGKAIALDLAREGVDVAIASRNLEDLEKAAREIEDATGRKIFPFALDVTKRDQVDRVIAEAAQKLGGLHILVNSASLPGGSPTATGPIDSVVDEDLIGDFDVKFVGALRCSRAAIPLLKEQGWGRIINVIGNDGIKPIYFEITPGAANAAGINFTLAIAEELAPFGITVNALNPGPVDTDRWWGLVRTMSREKGITEEEAQMRAISSIPIGRLCTPEEVADMVVFLGSERASFVTGAAISMDGGQRKAIMDV